MLPSDLYTRVREKERRLYTDQIVMHLPEIPIDHPHKVEWLARAGSTNRLLNYVVKFHPPMFILEVGCGNGWLSHKMSTLPGVHVIGLERGGIEIKQAERLFGSSNISFLSANIDRPPFNYHRFDVIVLASVIQYFNNLPALIMNLKQFLTTRGEIHILDSPIYTQEEVLSARERTRAYYAKLGFAEMADHYIHHTAEELNFFSPHWLYSPNPLLMRLMGILGRINSPFPWLYIR